MMNKYVIVEQQEKKVAKLEEERRLLSIDIRKATHEELDDTEKRIKSLRRKRNYLQRKIEENYSKGLGPKATMKVYDMLERLDALVKKRKKHDAYVLEDEA